MVCVLLFISVCNSITGTSSQLCYVCGSTPKNNNNIDQIKTLNSEHYRFGLFIWYIYN